MAKKLILDKFSIARTSLLACALLLSACEPAQQDRLNQSDLDVIATDPNDHGVDQSHDHLHGHHTQREAATHTHGTAEMTLVLDQQELVVDLRVPAVNLAGHEGAPVTQEERQRTDEVIKTLRSPKNMMNISPEAQCELSAAEVSLGLLNESANAHANFNIHYEFICENSLSLKRLDVLLFSRYPSLEKIQIEWIANDRQGTQVLMKNQTEMHF